MTKEQEEQGFRVTDRRGFREDGEPAAPAGGESRQPEQPAGPAGAGTSPKPEAGAGTPPKAEADAGQVIDCDDGGGMTLGQPPQLGKPLRVGQGADHQPLPGGELVGLEDRMRIRKGTLERIQQAQAERLDALCLQFRHARDDALVRVIQEGLDRDLARAGPGDIDHVTRVVAEMTGMADHHHPRHPLAPGVGEELAGGEPLRLDRLLLRPVTEGIEDALGAPEMTVGVHVAEVRGACAGKARSQCGGGHASEKSAAIHRRNVIPHRCSSRSLL